VLAVERASVFQPSLADWLLGPTVAPCVVPKNFSGS
jgi:hypothetical protein